MSDYSAGPQKNYNFSDEEIGEIKRIVKIAIEQGTPIDQMFPGESPLAQEASYLYLLMKGANFVFGVEPQEPDDRDLQLGELPQSVQDVIDLRPLCSPVENQENLSACSANAAVGALELLQKKNNNNQYADMSRLYIYYNSRVRAGKINEDSGVSLRYMMQSLANEGVCRESVWPYDTTQWATKPSQASYDEGLGYKISQYLALRENDVQQVEDTLSQGFPVIFGIWCFQEFLDADLMLHGLLPMPKNDSIKLGGHGLLVVGFSKVKKLLIVRNSWGPAFALHGYFLMPFEYFEKYAFNPWVITK